MGTEFSGSAVVDKFLKHVPTVTDIYEFSNLPEGHRSGTGKRLSNIIDSD